MSEKYIVQEIFHYFVYYLIYLEISSNLKIHSVSNPHITLNQKELVKQSQHSWANSVPGSAVSISIQPLIHNNGAT